MTEDFDLDEMLKGASDPPVPLQGPAAVLARIARESSRGAVVALPRREPMPLSAMLALAASLALGLYLGAAGVAVPWLGEDMAAVDAPVDFLGEADDTDEELT